MIKINKNISLNENELKFEFIRSSGPGGQNVNKVATAVQLRFDVFDSVSLPDDVKERIKAAAGKKINKEGILIIEAKRYRTQDKNRQDALKRLLELIEKSSVKIKKRVKTKAPASSNLKRITDKKKTSEKKKNRRIAEF